VILNGLHIQTGKDERLMPAFADELSDEQIAQIATFVMSEYGNPSVKVDAARVKTLRAGGDNPVDGLRYALVGGVIVALILIVMIVRRRRRKR
jgi:fructose 5-dehydrogenase cytochrome subunit